MTVNQQFSWRKGTFISNSKPKWDWSCSLCKGSRASFCTDHITRKFSGFSNIFSPGFTSRVDTPFHYNAFGYTLLDWDCFYDHLRDVSWEDILHSVLLWLLLDFVSKSTLESMHISFIINIRLGLLPLHTFQLLLLLS